MLIIIASLIFFREDNYESKLNPFKEELALANAHLKEETIKVDKLEQEIKELNTSISNLQDKINTKVAGPIMVLPTPELTVTSTHNKVEKTDDRGLFRRILDYINPF